MRPDCVAIWTRDFRGEADAGRPSIARAIMAVMDGASRVEHIVLAHRLGGLVRPTALLDTLNGLCRARWPLQTLLYSGRGQRRAVLEQVVPLRPRVVYLDTIRCLAIARDIRAALPDCRIVLDMDDLMSRRLEGWRARGSPLALGYVAASAGGMGRLLSAGPLRALLLGYEIGALHRAERRAAELADGIVLVSAHEAGLLRAHVGGAVRATIAAIPPAKALCPAAPARLWPLTFVFIGSDALLQNQATIDRLIALWREHRPAARLEIFGTMRRAYPDLPEGVRLMGFAPDLGDVYGPDRVLLAPSYIPGGIKTKVLEAFAHGCPVIGNASTFEGLDLTDYPLICPDDRALVALVAAPEGQAAAFDVAAAMGRRLLAEQHTQARFAARWLEMLGLAAPAPAPLPTMATS